MTIRIPASSLVEWLATGVGTWVLAFALFGTTVDADEPSASPFVIERTVASEGFHGKMCWVHARAGTVETFADAGSPLVVMTLQRLQLSGSDVFFALHEMRTTDGATTWTEPTEHKSFARIPFQYQGNDELEITVCDFTPKWHSKTQRLLGIGQTVVYENNRVKHVRPRGTAYAVYQPESRSWSRWRTLKMPDEARFANAGAGSVQRVDRLDGTILLPIYFKEIGTTQYSTTVVRCDFDGHTLKYLQHGSELTVPIKRGLYEPSLVEFDDRMFLTMRNDDHGYVSVSDANDLAFSRPKQWKFDDGYDLGNYNTQQHWVAHPTHGLWLIYTRRNAENDHVFRHRAPLFIAKVDPERLHVIKKTEQVLVPEKGARLGNFGVTTINENESWVTVTEWMQGPPPNPHDPEPLVKRGANNRIWVAKIKWNQPSAKLPPEK